MSAVIEEFTSLLKSFDPARSWADDLLILALILSGILLNNLVAKGRRRKSLQEREDYVRALAKFVLHQLRPFGAVSINASWMTRADQLELHVDLEFTSVVYRGSLGTNPQEIVDGMAAYLDSIPRPEEVPAPEVEQEPAAEEVAAAEPARRWWHILGISPNADRREISIAFRKLAMEYHPDKGGDQARMAEINAARDEAMDSAGTE